MIKKTFIISSILILLIANTTVISYAEVNMDDLKTKYIAKYKDLVPTEWGENVTGVRNSIDTEKKVIALTFDACGQGGLSDGYDKELIDFLIAENIPATLFISARWISTNEEAIQKLAKNPLFTIENHGYKHKPLSVNGNRAYSIKGTKNIEEVIEEIHLNTLEIESITGRTPKYFRSGTTHYDEVAVKIANDLGYEVINYNILGDAGATFNKDQIVNSALTAKPGSIFLYHMNRPETPIAEGIKEAVPILKERGFTFVKLENYHYNLAPRTTEELKRQEIIDLILDKLRLFKSRKYNFIRSIYINIRRG